MYILYLGGCPHKVLLFSIYTYAICCFVYTYCVIILVPYFDKNAVTVCYDVTVLCAYVTKYVYLRHKAGGLRVFVLYSNF